MELPANEERNLAHVDGYIIDTDTGEVTGEVNPDDSPITAERVDNILNRLLQYKAKQSSAQIRLRTVQAEMQERVDKAVLALMEDPDFLELKARESNLLKMERDATRSLDGVTAFHTPALRSYTEAVLAGQKTRTLKTEFGSLSLRKPAEKLEVIDEPKAIEWLMERDATAVKMEIVKTQAKKLLPECGDPSITGMQMVQGEDKFEVTL